MLPRPSLQATLIGPPSGPKGAARSLPSPLPAGSPHPTSAAAAFPAKKQVGALRAGGAPCSLGRQLGSKLCAFVQGKSEIEQEGERSNKTLDM